METEPRRLAKELCIRADPTWAFDPGEWLDLALGPEYGPARRVEDRIGVDSRGLVDRQPVSRAHQSQLRQVQIADADFSGLDEIRRSRWAPFLVTRSQGRLIHSPPSSTPRDSAARRSNQESTPWGSRLDGAIRPDPRGRPAARRTGRPDRLVRLLKSGRWHPTAVNHQHRLPARANPDRSPPSAGHAAVEQRPARDGSHNCACLGPGPTRKARVILLESEVVPSKQFMDRSSCKR